jgi:transposase
MLDDAFKLIESLRAELFKSRAKIQKALGEKEKAESERINATLKLDQAQATLLEKAMNAMSKNRRRNLERAFETATRGNKIQTCRKELYARLLSRSPGKTATERLKAQRTHRHQTGLTRTPSPALNRAAQAHALRQAGRGIEDTDGGSIAPRL